MTVRALLIIDVQQALVADVENGEALLARLAELVVRARATEVPVVFLQQNGAAGGPLAPGGHGWQLASALGASAVDVVIPKTATDGFYDIPLADVLRERGVDTVVVGGLASDYCVDATARSAVSHRLDVELLSDGHSTTNRAATGLTAMQIITHHNEILASAIHPGGQLRLVTCAEALPAAC